MEVPKLGAMATCWAWNQKLKSSHKLVLLSLADSCCDKSMECELLIREIHEKSGLNKKTVMLALRNIEEIGLISRRRSKGGGTVYKLLAANLLMPEMVLKMLKKSR